MLEYQTKQDPQDPWVFYVNRIGLHDSSVHLNTFRLSYGRLCAVYQNPFFKDANMIERFMYQFGAYSFGKVFPFNILTQAELDGKQA